MSPRRAVATITVVFLIALVLPMVLALVVLAPALGVDTSTLQGAGFRITAANMLVVLSFSLVSIGVVAAAWKYLHKRPQAEMGWGGEFWRCLVTGHLLGLGLAASSLAIRWIGFGFPTAQWAVPDDVGLASLAGHYAFFWLALLTLNSIKEEAVFRAYPLEALRHQIGRWPVILVSALLFSAVHLVLEPPSLLAFASRTAFGILACQIYLQRRSIWAAIGLHNGWNWLLLTTSGNWKVGGVLALEGPDTGSAGTLIHLAVQLIAIVVLERWYSGAPDLDNASPLIEAGRARRPG